MKDIEQKNSSRRSIAGAVIAAVAASLCCLGPLVLLALGVGGAWMSSLTALEPYRPVFILITFSFLGYAFYRIYRKSGAEECQPGSYCANPKSNRLNKIVLWIVTVFVLVLLAVPYAAPLLFSNQSGTESSSPISGINNPILCTDCASPVESGQVKTLVLKITGMTCASCQVTVRKSLARLEGVIQAEVNLKEKSALVQYDQAKITPGKLMKTTTDAGYPSQLVEE